MILIFGGTSSGKSAYAETLACKLSRKKIYLATMCPYGEEGRKKVENHREMRKEKGFITVERENSLGEGEFISELGSIFKKDSVSKKYQGVILIECLGNLLANEMFSNGEYLDELEPVIDKIDQALRVLDDTFEEIILVSSDVFSFVENYEKESMDYIKCLGKLHQKISVYANQVIEVVYSIPIQVK